MQVQNGVREPERTMAEVLLELGGRIGMKVPKCRQGLAFQFSHLHQRRENPDFLSTCPGVEQKEQGGVGPKNCQQTSKKWI